jgi:hypothetical protein
MNQPCVFRNSQDLVARELLLLLLLRQYARLLLDALRVWGNRSFHQRSCFTLLTMILSFGNKNGLRTSFLFKFIVCCIIRVAVRSRWRSARSCRNDFDDKSVPDTLPP